MAFAPGAKNVISIALKRILKNQCSVATGGRLELINDDCLDWLKKQQSDFFHLFLCDPPYELASITRPRPDLENASNPYARPQARAGFMGKSWDILPGPEIYSQIYRTLKPGGFFVAFSSPRTYHRIATDAESAGFIIHPAIYWIYGSGFPKASDISKHIDRRAGAEREVIGKKTGRLSSPVVDIRGGKYIGGKPGVMDLSNITAPATAQAKTWAGYKYGLQSLKPAAEPIMVCQKQWAGAQVDNILKTGAGALNIEESRISTGGPWKTPWAGSKNYKVAIAREGETESSGLFPANIIIDDRAGGIIDDQVKAEDPDDGASRFFQKCNYAAGDFDPFFYTSKPNSTERNAGAQGLKSRVRNRVNSGGYERDPKFAPRAVKNNHPTLKPVSIMVYLMRLFVGPVGPFRVVDPFLGSGTTGIASVLFPGVEFYGVEREPDYFEIARSRTTWAEENKEKIRMCFDPGKNKIDPKRVEAEADQILISDYLGEELQDDELPW